MVKHEYNFEVSINSQSMQAELLYDMTAIFTFIAAEPETMDSPLYEEELEVIEIIPNATEPTALHCLIANDLNHCDMSQLEDEILSTREDV